MSFKMLIALLGAMVSVCPQLAQAGASLLVDDAAVTPRDRCQLEAWARTYAPGQELTAVPACNFDGTEFGLSVSQFGRPSHGPILNLGAKRLFRDFDAHDWGVGMSVGATWSGEHGRLDGWNLNLPVSVALDSQRRTIVHANVGWNHLRDRGGALTGGLGLEQVLSERWTLLAEGYTDHTTTAQLGLRRSLGENASLDVLVAHQGGANAGPWLTLGFNVLLPD